MKKLTRRPVGVGPMSSEGRSLTMRMWHMGVSLQFKSAMGDSAVTDFQMRSVIGCIPGGVRKRASRASVEARAAINAYCAQRAHGE